MPRRTSTKLPNKPSAPTAIISIEMRSSRDECLTLVKYAGPGAPIDQEPDQLRRHREPSSRPDMTRSYAGGTPPSITRIAGVHFS